MIALISVTTSFVTAWRSTFQYEAVHVSVVGPWYKPGELELRVFNAGEAVGWIDVQSTVHVALPAMGELSEIVTITSGRDHKEGTSRDMSELLARIVSPGRVLPLWTWGLRVDGAVAQAAAKAGATCKLSIRVMSASDPEGRTEEAVFPCAHLVNARTAPGL
jgi:hypothetical protein